MKLIAILLCALLLVGCSAVPEDTPATVPPAAQTQPSASTAPTTAATTPVTAPPFQEVMVVDNEDCAIYISDFREDPVWGWVLDARLENKSESDTWMFAISSASVNTVQIDPLFAAQIAPGKKAKEQIHLSASTLKEHDVGLYTDIELYFRVYDAEDWMKEPVATPSIHIYPYGADKARPYVRQLQPNDQVLVDQKDFAVTVTGFVNDPVRGFTAQLFVQNKTDQRIMLTAENASVNGFMADPLFAMSVDPGNCAFGRMSWPDTVLRDLGITQVEKIEFILRAYDEINWTAEDIVKLPVKLTPHP